MHEYKTSLALLPPPLPHFASGGESSDENAGVGGEKLISRERGMGRR